MCSRKILLNFECGSKQRPVSPYLYPKKDQEKLLSLLEANGYSVTVLTDQPSGYRCLTVPYETVEGLDQILKSHAVFVGIDSFPFRYTAYLLNRPTICLCFPFQYETPGSNVSVEMGSKYIEPLRVLEAVHLIFKNGT
jgi:hypothetical protein